MSLALDEEKFIKTFVFIVSIFRMNLGCEVIVVPITVVKVMQVTKTSSFSDQELFTKCKAGHRTALGMLYVRYRTHVYRLAYHMLNNPCEAEDLTQDVFLGLCRSNFDPSRGALSSYLTVLTRSRAIDRLRSWGTASKFSKRLQQSLVTEYAPNTLDQVIVAEQGCKVRQALTRLPTRQRQILEMAYYEGLSQSKIADQMQAPLGTIKSWTRQGLRKLKVLI